MTILRKISPFVLMMLIALPSLADDASSDAGATAAAAAARVELDGPKLDVLLADIAKARAPVKTMRALFTQERRITLLATTVKSTGELLFAGRGSTAAPDGDRLRWDLAPPDDVVYFVGPEGLAYKTKTSSATVSANGSNGANVARALGDLRALLGGDLSTLRTRYTLAASRGADDVEITGVALTPSPTQNEANAPKNVVRAFTLVLDRNLVTPIRARLVEGKRDSIDLKFTNVVMNAPIEPARLRP